MDNLVSFFRFQDSANVGTEEQVVIVENEEIENGQQRPKGITFEKYHFPKLDLAKKQKFVAWLGVLLLCVCFLLCYLVFVCTKEKEWTSGEHHHLDLSHVYGHKVNHSLMRKQLYGNLDNQLIASEKADFVRNMTLSSWKAYRQYAWGHSALRPQSELPHNEHFGNNSGQTLLSSMSTLWVMNLTEQFAQSKKWIIEEFNLTRSDRLLNVAHLVTDFIGSLLSCYALTGDEAFSSKAKQLSDKLWAAYQTETGLPVESIYLQSGRPQVDKTWLTWFGGQQLEYNYLMNLFPNDTELTYRSVRMRAALKGLSTQTGLYGEMYNVSSGELNRGAVHVADLSWATRQFFQSLVISTIQTDGRDGEALRMFNDAMDAAKKEGLLALSQREEMLYLRPVEIPRETRTSTSFLETTKGHVNYKVVYLKDEEEDLAEEAFLKRDVFTAEKYMKFHACYMGGLLSLATNLTKETKRQTKYLKWAQQLTETCHEASTRSATGLAPWVFHFDAFAKKDATIDKGWAPSIYQFGNFLNPELAETYFLLWRATHQAKYREYAWEMVQALYEHARLPSGGYGQLLDVNRVPSSVRDYQPPYFLGATLKYLYLIFLDDESILPLDKWIFNTAGQPLPILKQTDGQGKNRKAAILKKPTKGVHLKYL